MTYQHDFLLFILLLPTALAVGLWLGHRIALGSLTASLRGENRPSIRLRRADYRLVTEVEFQKLKLTGRLEDVA